MNNLLLVDDDPTIRRIAEISLTRIGKWNVTTAESGAKALQILSSVTPDLIMLDVLMPQLDGIATFARLKELSAIADVPIIFMTAKVQTHEIQQYYDLGISGVIVKPFDPIKLPAEVQKIYEHAKKKSRVA